MSDPERTAATIDSDGWHRTGDLGRFDELGYLRVTGRLKDIIIRGGTNYPDERVGEKACAVVVPKPGERPTLEDITSFLTGRNISLQKLPEKIVLVDELPTTLTGKVQKFLLRDVARVGGD